MPILGNNGGGVGPDFSWTKVQSFETEELALEFASTLSISAIDVGYEILRQTSILLYEALQGAASLVAENLLPLRFTFLGTKRTITLIELQNGVPTIHDFRLPDKDLTISIKPVKILTKWFVFYFDLEVVNPYIAGSENDYYTIDGTYGLGTSFSPVHKMRLSEILIDAGIITSIAALVTFLGHAGLGGPATKLAAQGLAGIGSLGTTQRLDEIEDSVEAVGAQIVTVQNTLMDEVAGLAKIANYSASALNELSQLTEMVTFLPNGADMIARLEVIRKALMENSLRHKTF